MIKDGQSIREIILFKAWSIFFSINEKRTELSCGRKPKAHVTKWQVIYQAFIFSFVMHFSVGILWSHFPIFPDLLSSSPLRNQFFVFTSSSSTWVLRFASVLHFASALFCFIFPLSCPDPVIHHFNNFLPRKTQIPHPFVLLFLLSYKSSTLT